MNKWSGPLNHISMAHLLSNICTKNYLNRTTIVEIIVGSWMVSFLRQGVFLWKEPVKTHKPQQNNVKCAAGSVVLFSHVNSGSIAWSCVLPPHTSIIIVTVWCRHCFSEHAACGGRRQRSCRQTHPLNAHEQWRICRCLAPAPPHSLNWSEKNIYRKKMINSYSKVVFIDHCERSTF